MKKLHWLGLLAWMVAIPAMAQGLDGRIVFVNLDKVFSEFHKTKSADTQLRQVAQEFADERSAMVEEFETMNERFNTVRERAQDIALSEDVRAEKRNEAENLLIDIREFEQRVQEFDQSRRRQIEEQGRRIRERLVAEIQEEIRKYARSQGVSAVLDSSGQSLNAVENVIFVETRFDITDAILEILNRGR